MSTETVSAPDVTAPLVGKRVVVTGASRGIGAACAVGCAGAGAGHVALLARSATRLRDVAGWVRQAGASVSVHPVDVTDTEALVEAVTSLGPLDVLINCAGTNRPEPLLDVQPATFEAILRLNVGAAFFATQAAARTMIAHERAGVIINISSQMGHVGAPLRSVYCTSKHALEGMTKASALELAEHGIRVVSIAPTFVRTEMTASQLDDPEVGGALLAQIPLGRFVTVQEVAAAVVYAASPAAASLTGCSVRLDGGWTAR